MGTRMLSAQTIECFLFRGIKATLLSHFARKIPKLFEFYMLFARTVDHLDGLAFSSVRVL